MTRQPDGSWLVSPKQLGVMLGSAFGALLLSVISIYNTMNINDTDRYTGTQADEDLAVMTNRLTHLENDFYRHTGKGAHDEAAEELSELRERLESVRREHDWMKGINGSE